MYSDRLKEMRVGHDFPECYKNKHLKERVTTLPEDVAPEKLRHFCMAEDLVGVNPTVAWNLFNEYLNVKCGGKSVTVQAFGRLVRKCFPCLRLRKRRIGSEFTYVYDMERVRL